MFCLLAKNKMLIEFKMYNNGRQCNQPRLTAYVLLFNISNWTLQQKNFFQHAYNIYTSMLLSESCLPCNWTVKKNVIGHAKKSDGFFVSLGTLLLM